MVRYHIATGDGKAYYGVNYESYREAKAVLEFSQKRDPQAHIVEEEYHFTNADRRAGAMWRRCMLMADLKPCPFCGDKSELIQTTCLSNGCVLYHVYHYSLRCPTNGIRTENRPTADEAIEAWNRRVTDG